MDPGGLAGWRRRATASGAVAATVKRNKKVLKVWERRGEGMMNHRIGIRWVLGAGRIPQRSDRAGHRAAGDFRGTEVICDDQRSGGAAEFYSASRGKNGGENGEAVWRDEGAYARREERRVEGQRRFLGSKSSGERKFQEGRSGDTNDRGIERARNAVHTHYSGGTNRKRKADHDSFRALVLERSANDGDEQEKRPAVRRDHVHVDEYTEGRAGCVALRGAFGLHRARRPHGPARDEVQTGTASAGKLE